MIVDYKKQMIQVFEKYRYKFEPYSLFERFMEFVITGFDITLSVVEKPLSKDETEPCMELLNAWITSMNEALKHNEWYDLLGDVYMDYLSGTMKKHWTGQYFTPMNICELMAKITDPGERTGERIMDCACGSGRMLLASHILHPGNYCCAQDMDKICCLMTVCNFIIHGVNGEVVWGNSLDPSDYRGGWRTNEVLNIIGVPCVRTMDKMEAISYRNGLLMLEKKDKPENKVLPVEEHSAPKKSIIKSQKEPRNLQLSLFDEL